MKYNDNFAQKFMKSFMEKKKNKSAKLKSRI